MILAINIETTNTVVGCFEQSWSMQLVLKIYLNYMA